MQYMYVDGIERKVAYASRINVKGGEVVLCDMVRDVFATKHFLAYLYGHPVTARIYP